MSSLDQASLSVKRKDGLAETLPADKFESIVVDSVPQDGHTVLLLNIEADDVLQVLALITLACFWANKGK